jgi:hypothetical protein
MNNLRITYKDGYDPGGSSWTVSSCSTSFVRSPFFPLDPPSVREGEAFILAGLVIFFALINARNLLPYALSSSAVRGLPLLAPPVRRDPDALRVLASEVGRAYCEREVDKPSAAL